MITIKIRFRPSSIPGKKGTLFYSLVHNRKSKQITTPYRIFRSEWNEQMQMVVPGRGERTDELVVIQKRIERDIDLLYRIKDELKDGGDYSLARIVSQFKSETVFPVFFSFMDEQIRILKRTNQAGTARNYQSARNSFSCFCGNRDLEIAAITEELICDYESWLGQRRIVKNTASFYIRGIRAVYNKAAASYNIKQRDPFKKVYTGVERTRKRAVDETTIVRLKTADLSKSRVLSFTRDLFLFSFYTRGMAFVDLAYLKKQDIRNGEIRYKRRKTGSSLVIGLEPCMEEIIDRSKDRTARSDYLFPIIREDGKRSVYMRYLNALNYYNKQLKRLSEILGLAVPLTFYVARHTWATMARNRHIPVSVISAGMGHSSEKITEIYLASVQDSVVDDVNRLIINDLKEIEDKGDACPESDGEQASFRTP